MRRELLVCGVLLAGASGAAHAQGASALTPTQQLGGRLFGQDCGVCHLQPTIINGRFGPALSRDLVKGNEAAIAAFISHGSARMPGFQYYYRPDQIEAIVEYLDTVPAPAPGPAASTAKPASGGSADTGSME